MQPYRVIVVQDDSSRTTTSVVVTLAPRRHELRIREARLVAQTETPQRRKLYANDRLIAASSLARLQ
jgi:hypothetical protein